MSSVQSIFANTPGATQVTTNTIGYTTRAPKQVLDQNDFMKLLTTQLSNQDPMQPQDNTAMISQMASFTSLSEMNSLVSSFNSLSSVQSLSTANSYIGRQVTVKTGDSNNPSVTGVVSGVDNSTGTPQIIVDGAAYPLTSVTQISTPTTTTTAG